MSSSPGVLVVEDQRIDWEVLEPILRSKGLDPDWARTEQEARDLLGKHVQNPRYVGAIIDIMVPVDKISPTDDRDAFEKSLDSGTRICKHVRDALALKPDDFKLVILSILDREDMQIDLEKYGVVYFGKIEFALNRERFIGMLVSMFGGRSDPVTPPGSTD